MLNRTQPIFTTGGLTTRLIAITLALILPGFVRAAPDNAAFLGTANPLAIHQALRNGDIGLLRDLLINGDPALVQTPVGRGARPLHVAASLDQADAAELLIQYGAGVEDQTEGGFTPLHWAAGRNAVETAKVLIAHGANVDAASAAGIRPLHWAAQRNAVGMVELLLAAGARADVETLSGALPIHLAHMGQSESAALLIAERMIAQEMDEEKEPGITTAASHLPQDAIAVPTAAPLAPAPSSDPAPAAPASAAPPDVYITREGSTMGQALVVAIGLGENLVFEWIEPLKLWAGKYEVTNGQFRRFRPGHTSRARENISLDGNDQPVVYVSWHDAQAFCEWLNRTYRDRLPKGFTFRLPSSVEWTQLARCGDQRMYPWGNRWPPAYGNYSDLTAREHLAAWNGIAGYTDGFAVTAPVTQSGINEWGLYGVGGNVWEWCLDDYPGDKRYKIRRGGSWDFDPEPSLRIDMIGFDRPDVRDDTIGFRVVATMAERAGR